MNGNAESSAQIPSQPSLSVPPLSTSQPSTSLPPSSTSQPSTSQPPPSSTSQPSTSQPPPVAALPTPKTKLARHSIFSYVPLNPQLSHRGQGALPGQKTHITSAIPPQGHSENFPPKTGVPGGNSLAPQGVGVTAIPSSELWDMSVIQTAPQAPLGTRGARDQDKCPQQ